MHENLHERMVVFNNKASKIYDELFARFSNSVQTIRRKGDENVYKMQAAKYLDELKKQLAAEAKKLIAAYPEEQARLSPLLLSRVNFYLQEFAVRCHAR